MVAALECQHAGPTGRKHRRLQGGLDGITAVLPQNDLSIGQGDQPRDALTEPDLDFGGVNVAHAVQQLLRLRPDGGDNARVAVAHRGDSEGRRHVEKAVAVNIGDEAAPRLLPEDGEVGGQIGDVGTLSPAESPGQFA